MTSGVVEVYLDGWSFVRFGDTITVGVDEDPAADGTWGHDTGVNVETVVTRRQYYQLGTASRPIDVAVEIG